MAEIQLVPLETSDREQFIRDNQEAFNYGALEEFGQRDDHFEEDGEIISHDTISRAIDEGTAFRIMQDNKPVGGVVIRTEYDHGELELLFVSPDVHSKGIGYAEEQKNMSRRGTSCGGHSRLRDHSVWQNIEKNDGFYLSLT